MEWISVIGWIVGTLVVILGPMMLVHELGHFISAKLAGVRVEEFGFGYPPRLVKLWRSRGRLVIGEARVSIPGRVNLPPWVDVGSRVDLLVDERRDGVLVLRAITALESADPPAHPSQERNGNHLRIRGTLSEYEPGTTYSLNVLPMGAFVRMKGEDDPSHPRSLAAQPKRQRLAVMASGAALNLLAAVVLLVSAYSLAGVPGGWLVEIESVEPETAAAQAELLAGDIVVAVDGRRLVGGDEEFRSIVLDSPQKDLVLDILRDGEELSLVATPRPGNDGVGYLGVYMGRRPDPASMAHLSVPDAVAASASDIWDLVTFPFRIRSLLAEGTVTPQQVRPNSVVGIGGVLTLFVQQSIAWRWAFPVVHTAGLVSLSLGIANLLPLPALDGGRILFVLIEAVRGRRIPPEREAMVHAIGLLVLVGLMALVMVQDVINPVIPWSWLMR
jgi:regulator of sigma E protease